MAIFRERFYWLLAGLGLLAAVLALRQMHWGPWAFSDSAAYISAARNLVEGHGLSVQSPSGTYRPLTLHQPLYPWVMAGFLLLGIHPFTSTMALNAVSAFAVVFVVSAGVYALTRAKALALFLALCMLSFPVLADNLGGAMSEPLYLALMLAGFVFLQIHLDRQPRWALYAAALCAGLTVLARLVGAANVAAGVLALLLLLPASWRARLRAAALFGAIGVLPTVAWQLSLPALAGRSFEMPGDMPSRINAFWYALVNVLGGWLPVRSAWGLPGLLSAGISALLVAMLAGSLLLALWLLVRRQAVPAWARLSLVAGAQAAAYTLVCFAAFAFSDVTPDINDRTMLPLFPLLLIVIGSGLWGIFATRPKVATASLAALALLCVLAWAPATQKLVAERYEMGHGYTATYYRGSVLLQTARELPQDVPWISNEPALFLLYLNKPTHDLGTMYPQMLTDGNLPLGQGDTPLDRLFREDDAILLLYPLQIKAALGEWALGHVDNLVRGLRPLYDGHEGLILIAPE